MSNTKSSMGMYKETYNAVCNLPMVVRLKNDNKVLTKQVISYKHKIQVLEDMLYRTIQDNHKCKNPTPTPKTTRKTTFCNLCGAYEEDTNEMFEFYGEPVCSNCCYVIKDVIDNNDYEKQEKEVVVKVNGTHTFFTDDDTVLNNENIVYELNREIKESLEENPVEEGVDEVEEEDVDEVEEVEEETAEEEVDEEDEEVEEETVEEEVEEETVEEDDVDEVKAVEVEETVEEEVYGVTINGKLYYTTNEVDGTIYSSDGDEIGDEVGSYIKGKAVFNK